MTHCISVLVCKFLQNSIRLNAASKKQIKHKKNLQKHTFTLCVCVCARVWYVLTVFKACLNYKLLCSDAMIWKQKRLSAYRKLHHEAYRQCNMRAAGTENIVWYDINTPLLYGSGNIGEDGLMSAGGSAKISPAEGAAAQKRLWTNDQRSMTIVYVCVLWIQLYLNGRLSPPITDECGCGHNQVQPLSQETVGRAPGHLSKMQKNLFGPAPSDDQLITLLCTSKPLP